MRLGEFLAEALEKLANEDKKRFLPAAAIGAGGLAGGLGSRSLLKSMAARKLGSWGILKSLLAGKYGPVVTKHVSELAPGMRRAAIGVGAGLGALGVAGLYGAGKAIGRMRGKKKLAANSNSGGLG